MRCRRQLRRTSIALALSAGLLAAGIPATANAAAPWCDTSIWSSAKLPTLVLGGRLKKAIDIIEDVDHIADVVTLVLAVISGGVAVPAFAVKLVVKVGKHRLTRMLKKVVADLGRVNKRKAGVRITVKCLLGLAPYPSLGVYT